MEILKPSKREQLLFNKLVLKACKQMVGRAKKVNRLARQTAWGDNRRAMWHKAHVTAWWAHLVDTKGQDYVTKVVALRKAKREGMRFVASI